MKEGHGGFVVLNRNKKECDVLVVHAPHIPYMRYKSTCRQDPATLKTWRISPSETALADHLPQRTQVHQLVGPFHLV